MNRFSLFDIINIYKKDLRRIKSISGLYLIYNKLSSVIASDLYLLYNGWRENRNLFINYKKIIFLFLFKSVSPNIYILYLYI